MNGESLKNLCNHRAVAIRKQAEEIENLKRLLSVQQEATARALHRAERAEKSLEKANERASSLAGELDALRCRLGYPDPGDYDDGQPDEIQEWRDYDPDC